MSGDPVAKGSCGKVRARAHGTVETVLRLAREDGGLGGFKLCFEQVLSPGNPGGWARPRRGRVLGSPPKLVRRETIEQPETARREPS